MRSPNFSGSVPSLRLSRWLRSLVAPALVLLAALPATAQLAVDAGPNVVLECEDPDGTEYTLNGSVPDDPGVTFTWSTLPALTLEDDDTLTTTGQFPVGVTTVTLAAQLDTLTGSDSATVTVEDTEPPTARASADPMVLWPPNHEMHRVRVTLRIRDACSAEQDFEVELISATSDEPDNGRGDGNTTNDIQNASIGEDDRDVLLRAERQGGGDGRVYTLTYLITDAAGNETRTQARVYVPHDYSDVKDRLDDEFDGDGDLDAICPQPDTAAEEFVEAVPRIASFPSLQNCLAACSAWARGCNGIVDGTTRCVSAEIRSLARVEAAACNLDEGAEKNECLQQIRQEAGEALGELNQQTREGGRICANVGQRCTNACSDLFDPNGDAYDDEGVGEE